MRLHCHLSIFDVRQLAYDDDQEQQMQLKGDKRASHHQWAVFSRCSAASFEILNRLYILVFTFR